MFKKSLISVLVVSSLAACGGGDNDELKNNTRGNIVITGTDLFAGATLTAEATDADGIQADTIDYTWSSGKDGLTKTSGTSITITEADVGYPILASARYTDNEGFTEGVGASTEDIKPTFNVSASIVKGPVEGAICEIYEVTANGEAVLPQEADAPSDASGNVSFTNAHIANNGLLSCTGGSYIDESTGSTLDAPQLRSVVNVVEDGGAAIDEDGNAIIDADGNEVRLPAPVYIVSPLTEIAVQNTEADFNNFDEVAEDINSRFGIRFDTTEVAPTVVGTDALGADGAEESDRYGSVLALISQLDADNTEADISTVITDLSTDIADGDFADSLDLFETAQTNLETTSAVASSVDSSLLSIIGASVGYNDAEVTAIIEGELSGTARNTAEEAFQGTVTIIDPNFNEESFIEQTDVALTYGTFSISANGVWTYKVNTENETVATLEVGASVNDPVTIQSADGTTAVIEIRVAALTQVVEITNIAGDTGEILFRVDNLRQGKLSASILKETAVGSDGNSKDAYIKLGGSSGSNSEALIDLRIQGDQTSIDVNGTETPIAPRLFVRNTDSDAYPGDILTEDFIENEFHEIDITWDLDATEQITVSLDGEEIFGGSFSTAAVVDSDFENLDQWFVDGIQTIQFRFGDNGTTVPFGSYFIDNIEVFSDTTGTTSVFSDDFENTVLGDSLDGDGSAYTTAIYSEVAVFDAGDGTVEQTPAVFFDVGGAIASDETSVTGAVSVQDPNEGEASITATTTVGTYGTFNIEVDGSWTYTLDTTDATIAALIVGERETDSFTITSFDGTTAAFDILISGTIVVNTGANNVAVIVDTLDSDTGELRYALSENPDAAKQVPLAAGRIEVKVKRLDDDLGDGDAFITLFNSDTNNAGAILDLRIRDNSFGLRSPSDVDTSAASVILDTFMDVVITWEYPNGDLTMLPLVKVEIDGVSFTADGFTPDNSAIGGVTHVAFRFGDNGGTRAATGKFTIDDFILFSDTAGTTQVFADDFELYADGDSLDTDNAASSYNSSTSEATIETIAGVGGPGTPGNKIAEIRDTDAGDTGELRYALSENPDAAKQVPLAQGRFEVAIKRLDDDLGDGDAFITLFNSDTNNAGAILDLRIRDNSFGLRSPSDVDTSAATVVLDTFMDVVITWEYPNGDLTLLPLVTVEVDGVPFTTSGFTPDNSAIGGVTHFAIRFGDNGGVREATGVVSIDNLAIYSDTAGTVEVFSDDFESYVADDSLDTDNAASPYNSSTSEAISAEE